MKVKILITALALLLTITGYAEVRKTDSVQPIEQEFAASGSKTLILVDIGQTLAKHKDPIFNSKNEGWKRSWIQSQKPGISRSEIIQALRIVEGDTQNWELVEESWPKLIAQAQKNGAKVIAFTKTYLDSSLKGFCIDNLKKLGLPFQDALRELPSGKTYEYDNGVIKTEANLKGPVLKEIVANLKEKPEKIIFIDDRIEQVESVEKACKEMNIPCLAYHYTASEKAIPTLDEKVADYQLKTLMRDHRWLTQEEAQQALIASNKQP